MKRVIVYFLLLSAVIVGCKKQDSQIPVLVKDIYPLQVGKAFFYRLDSTVTINFGAALVVRSYHAKDSVESSFLDNQGRESYRIFRYLRDTLNTQAWQYSFTYYATFTNTHVEFVDNNLRFVPIANNVALGNQWKGTQYINTTSGSEFDFLNDWTFEYQSTAEPYTVKMGTIDSTYTVLQRDEVLPDVPFDIKNYQEKSYAVEVYAKGIGLIYKDFLRWVYQPVGGANAGYTGYGIKLNLMDYK